MQTLNYERPIIFFDTETTGVVVHDDRIISLAYIKVDKGEITHKYLEYFNPGIPIPVEATKIHGISDDQVKDKPSFKTFIPEIEKHWQGCALAGYNIASYDIPLLEFELERHGHKMNFVDYPVIDCHEIFKRSIPKTLADALRYFCDREPTDAHNALGDVLMTWDVFNCQLGRCKGLPESVDGIAGFCIRKEDNWCDSRGRLIKSGSQMVYNYGKHKGKDVAWVHQRFPTYLSWQFEQGLGGVTEEMMNKVDLYLSGKPGWEPATVKV